MATTKKTPKGKKAVKVKDLPPKDAKAVKGGYIEQDNLYKTRPRPS